MEKKRRTTQESFTKQTTVWVNSALVRERYNTNQDSAVFPRLPQILSIFIPTASTTLTWSLLVSFQHKRVKIHTLRLSWWAPFFSLPICDRSGKTAVNYTLCWTKHGFTSPHHNTTIPRKRNMAIKVSGRAAICSVMGCSLFNLLTCINIIILLHAYHTYPLLGPYGSLISPCIPPWPSKWTPWVSVKLEMSKHFFFKSINLKIRPAFSKISSKGHLKNPSPWHITQQLTNHNKEHDLTPVQNRSKPLHLNKTKTGIIHVQFKFQLLIFYFREKYFNSSKTRMTTLTGLLGSSRFLWLWSFLLNRCWEVKE